MEKTQPTQQQLIQKYKEEVTEILLNEVKTSLLDKNFVQEKIINEINNDNHIQTLIKSYKEQNDFFVLDLMEIINLGENDKLTKGIQRKVEELVAGCNSNVNKTHSSSKSNSPANNKTAPKGKEDNALAEYEKGVDEFIDLMISSGVSMKQVQQELKSQKFISSLAGKVIEQQILSVLNGFITEQTKKGNMPKLQSYDLFRDTFVRLITEYNSSIISNNNQQPPSSIGANSGIAQTNAVAAYNKNLNSVINTKTSASSMQNLFGYNISIGKLNLKDVSKDEIKNIFSKPLVEFVIGMGGKGEKDGEKDKLCEELTSRITNAIRSDKLDHEDTKEDILDCLVTQTKITDLDLKDLINDNYLNLIRQLNDLCKVDTNAQFRINSSNAANVKSADGKIKKYLENIFEINGNEIKLKKNISLKYQCPDLFLKEHQEHIETIGIDQLAKKINPNKIFLVNDRTETLTELVFVDKQKVVHTFSSDNGSYIAEELKQKGIKYENHLDLRIKHDGNCSGFSALMAIQVLKDNFIFNEENLKKISDYQCKTDEEKTLYRIYNIIVNAGLTVRVEGVDIIAPEVVRKEEKLVRNTQSSQFLNFNNNQNLCSQSPQLINQQQSHNSATLSPQYQNQVLIDTKNQVIKDEDTFVSINKVGETGKPNDNVSNPQQTIFSNYKAVRQRFSQKDAKQQNYSKEVSGQKTPRKENHAEQLKRILGAENVTVNGDKVNIVTPYATELERCLGDYFDFEIDKNVSNRTWWQYINGESFVELSIKKDVNMSLLNDALKSLQGEIFASKASSYCGFFGH